MSELEKKVTVDALSELTNGAFDKYLVYAVVKGDTLTAIAKIFGTSVANLVKLNGLANPDRLAIGQLLIVPRRK